MKKFLPRSASVNKTVIQIDTMPVGVKILSRRLKRLETKPLFRGISYCQAVTLASQGHEWRLLPGSIAVCQWAPVTLGFKPAENRFEESIEPCLNFPIKGIYLAPLHCFTADFRPDVVVLRAPPGAIRNILGLLPPDEPAIVQDLPLHMSAVGFVQPAPRNKSGRLIRHVNRGLDMLNHVPGWQSATALVFKSTHASWLLDRFITRYMANMSICRNSTVIPYLTGKANVSFFCTGGIAWGKNHAARMVLGLPGNQYDAIADSLTCPGNECNQTQDVK